MPYYPRAFLRPCGAGSLPNAPGAGLVAGIASKPWREDARFWAVERFPRLSDRCRFALSLRAACFAVSTGAAPGGGGPGTSAGLSLAA